MRRTCRGCTIEFDVDDEPYIARVEYDENERGPYCFVNDILNADGTPVEPVVFDKLKDIALGDAQHKCGQRILAAKCQAEEERMGRG